MPSRSEFGGIFAFTPPYDRLEQCGGNLNDTPVVEPGTAVVWRLLDADRQESEFERLRRRACGLPLIVLLPPPSEIIATIPLLNLVPLLHPKGVLPDGRLATPGRLRAILAAPPQCLSDSVIIYLGRRGVLPEKQLRREVHRIFDLAPDVASISKLARRLYTSRRTLGRHLTGAGLPVPSHWLQFARLLHVAIQLQNDNATIFRVATRTGYPDGFTMSNQMKRMLNVRPSMVRRNLGWEWLVEAWLMRELKSGRLDPRRYGLEWL